VITRWLVRRVDDRLALSPRGRGGLLDRVFPDHWSFMLGEVATYAFGYLVLSGLWLTLFFDSSDATTVYTGSFEPLRGTPLSAPYASVVGLSWDVRLGLVMRQSHHWAALIFTAVIVVHLGRVFFTGAFRRPRELNWMVGVALLILSILVGFTGYDLPDDLLSGMGLNIVNSVLLSIPLIGTWLSFMLFGGEFPGHHIIQRLYVIHAIVGPALIAGLLVLHVILVVRQRHTQFPGPGRTDTNVVGPRLWPARTVRSLGLMALVFSACALLGGLVQIDPIWLWGDFKAGRTMGPSQPDWYTGWIDGALRLYPGWEPVLFGWRMPNVFIPGVIMPGLTFVVLFLWPFLERLVTKDRQAHQLLQRPRERPGRVAVGVWAFTFYPLLLTAWGLDVISRYTGVAQFTLVTAFRWAVVFLPLITGTVAFLLAKALRDSGAEALMELTWQDLKGSLRRRPRPPREEVPLAEEEAVEHIPVETGPVP
jgi:ubiquinol-cytochrome c reductase cytochrome b subunit